MTDPSVSWPTAQTIAYDGVLNLQRKNVWNDDQLFKFARDYLISIDGMFAFYNAQLNAPPPSRPTLNPQALMFQNTDTWPTMLNYLVSISQMPAFYNYLLAL